jgi:hypothetical protein
MRFSGKTYNSRVIPNGELISSGKMGQNSRRFPTIRAFQLHSRREFGFMCDCVATHVSPTFRQDLLATTLRAFRNQ